MLVHLLPMKSRNRLAHDVMDTTHANLVQDVDQAKYRHGLDNYRQSFFFFFLLSNHSHQVDYLVAMVHSGYVCVAIIHQTLTWTTGSLSLSLIHI